MPHENPGLPYKGLGDLRLYKPNDPYYFEVDNLPLLDLLGNTDYLKVEIDNIFQELAGFVTRSSMNIDGIGDFAGDDKWLILGNLIDIHESADRRKTSIENGMVLMFDTGTNKWKAGFLPVNALDDLTDVVLTGPEAGEHLIYAATGWKNAVFEQAPGTMILGTGITQFNLRVGRQCTTDTARLVARTDGTEVQMHFNDFNGFNAYLPAGLYKVSFTNSFWANDNDEAGTFAEERSQALSIIANECAMFTKGQQLGPGQSIVNTGAGKAGVRAGPPAQNVRRGPFQFECVGNNTAGGAANKPKQHFVKDVHNAIWAHRGATHAGPGLDEGLMYFPHVSTYYGRYNIGVTNTIYIRWPGPQQAGDTTYRGQADGWPSILYGTTTGSKEGAGNDVTSSWGQSWGIDFVYITERVG
jgi:hypothetical protein